MDVLVGKDRLSKPINSISKDSVHKICSGQVILNLATAVKELVENSLDAGATFIEVRLKEYGSETVEVIDNGSGVEESNMEGLTLKHHTSKLQEFEGLTSVETFGFRGEALSSLCALSDLTIVTRHKTADCGTKLQFDYKGHIKVKQPCARQVGTTVMLQNLFSPLPVRQKEFQRNLQREFAKMLQLLYAYCLVSTGVKITCSNVTKKSSRKVVVSTQGSLSVQENIACVFGTKQSQSLLQMVQKLPSETMLQESGFPAMFNENLFELEGYISSCDHGSGRSTTDRQFFYINSRPCEPVKVVKVVNEVYHQFNQNQYPFVFLNMKTARNEVDVNVTPDKRQIFLENEKALLLIIKASLLHLYESIPSTMKYQNVSLSAPSPPVTTTRGDLSAMLRRWSKSPADVQSPVTAQGVKRTSSSGEDDKKSRKVLCLTNFFTRTPKLCVNTTSEEDRDKGNARVTVSVEENTVPVESATLSDNSTAAVDDLEVVPVNENDGVIVPGCMSLSEVSASTSELAEVINTDNNAVDTNKCLSKGHANLVADITIAKSEFSQVNDSKTVSVSGTGCASLNGKSESSQVADSKTVTLSNTKCAIVNSRSELSQVIDSKSMTISNTECASLNNKAELSQVTDNKTVTVPDRRYLSFDGKNELSLVETTVIIDDTDSECNKTSEEFHSKTLDITMDDIRERISQLREKQQNQKGGNEVMVRFRAEINPSKNKIAEQELSKEITKDMFAKMEILGQFNLGFIITRLGPDLFIIDQHATDEKYNFEILQRDTIIQNQKLVIPQTLELTAANESILIENEEIFKRNGFDFTVDETGEPMKRVKLQAIPVSRNWHFGKEDIDELLFMLQDSPHTMCRPSRVRAMFASRACRKSVMIGTALSKSDMRRLVDHMGELEQPWNCPHGRPTMRHLVNLDLLRLGDRPQFT